MCSKCKGTRYITLKVKKGGKFSGHIRISCPACHGTGIGK